MLEPADLRTWSRQVAAMFSEEFAASMLRQGGKVWARSPDRQVSPGNGGVLPR
ncbi:hypothetical protein [Actinoplanes sp. NPDC049118]|uniref:hypothetical protein n=1 Tax=Actinoplanes sp. NPDC049118 TaxID=3155769 RepID=UPI0033C385BA